MTPLPDDDAAQRTDIAVHLLTLRVKTPADKPLPSVTAILTAAGLNPLRWDHFAMTTNQFPPVSNVADRVNEIELKVTPKDPPKPPNMTTGTNPAWWRRTLGL
jgi:hypothetical protein